MYSTHPSSGWSTVSGSRRVVISPLTANKAVTVGSAMAIVVLLVSVAGSQASVPVSSKVVVGAWVAPAAIKAGPRSVKAAGPSRPSPRIVVVAGADWRLDVNDPAIEIFRWRRVEEVALILVVEVPFEVVVVVVVVVVVGVVGDEAVGARCRPRSDTAAAVGMRELWICITGAAAVATVVAGIASGDVREWWVGGGTGCGSGSCGSRAIVRRARRGGGGDSSAMAALKRRSSSDRSLSTWNSGWCCSCGSW